MSFNKCTNLRRIIIRLQTTRTSSGQSTLQQSHVDHNATQTQAKSDLTNPQQASRVNAHVT